MSYPIQDGAANDEVFLEDDRQQNVSLSTSELGKEEVSGAPSSTISSASAVTTSKTAPVTTATTPPVNSVDAQRGTAMSDTTESECDKVPELIDLLSGTGECTSQHKGREVVNVVLTTSVDRLFTLLFSDSKFFVDFHVSRNSTNIEPSPWTHSANNEKIRTVSVTVNINQPMIGKRLSHVTENQVMLQCSKSGYLYAIDSESQNAGIPYADSFTVVYHYCLKKVSDDKSSLLVYADIKYKKSVMGFIKGFIVKHTWVGVEEYFGSMVKALQAQCCDKNNAEEVAPKLRRPLRKSSQRLSLKRIKDDSMVPRSQSSIRRRSLTQGSVGARESSVAGIGSSPTKTGIESMNISILGFLVVLLLLNGALYYQLNFLEKCSTIDSIPPYLNIDVQALSRNPPTSPEGWIQLLRQQESSHAMAMQKWHNVLQSSITLLRQTEDSLKEMQVLLKPGIRHSLTSIIKDLTESINGNENVRAM